MSNIVIVIPTYNESENIGRLLDILFKDEFPKIKDHKMMVLVVDDHSPDGTWKIVKDLQKKYKNLYLDDSLTKRGLGGAYIDGFNYAIKKLKADALMEMDADFQHDPKDVKRFVAEFDKGSDYVIGARYIKGGSIPKDWGFKRVFLSVGGNLFTRTALALWMWDIHDFTTGFRLARVKGFLDQMDFSKIFSRSYSYKMRLLYEMKRRHAKVTEIPINFAHREKGWSKMDSDDFKESLKVIAQIWAVHFGLRQ